MYVIEDKSINKIVKKFKVSPSTVTRKLIEYEIPIKYSRIPTEKTRKKLRENHVGMKGRKQTEETRKKIKKTLTGRIRYDMINLWKNREYREKTVCAVLKGLAKKPNKPEKILIKLLDKILPNEYKYTGNGKISIDGFNPDFVHKKEKKIIEMFGDYWHANPDKYKSDDIVHNYLQASQIWEKDRKRLKAYKKDNYKTLFIWEKELKSLDRLILKLLKFNNRKK